jgi:hypothetical protein
MSLHNIKKKIPGATLRVEQTPASAIFDTGSEVSLISDRLYLKIKHVCTEIPAKRIHIATADGTNYPILGSIWSQLILME